MGANKEKPRECLCAVYLSPYIEFAIAVSARIQGETKIRHKAGTIFFDYPENFDPEEKIYVYSVDISKIPEANLIKVDEEGVQVAIVGFGEIIPVKVEIHKAGEILKYYRIIKGESV